MSEYFIYRLLIKQAKGSYSNSMAPVFQIPFTDLTFTFVIASIQPFSIHSFKTLFFFSVMSNDFKIIEVKNNLVFKESNCTVCVFQLEFANLMEQLVFPVGSSHMQSPLLMLITLPFNYLWLPTGKTHSYVQCLLILIVVKKYFSSFQPNTALIEHCCDIVSNGYNIVPALQRCVELKIVVANLPV